MSRYPRFALTAVVGFIFFSLSILFYSQSERIAGHKTQAPLKIHDNQTHDSTIHDHIASAFVQVVRNATLGFEKVFVLNFPEFTDRLDLISLASSITGFTFDVIEGVKGEDINNKSLPSLNGIPTSDNPDKARVIGAWRAHMNTAQTIVRNRISSALILEDDADWDTHLKDQLELFAQGSQFVTGTPPGKTPHSPYGEDWDLLWLGHCSTGINENIDRRFVIENDFTVPPIERRVNYAGTPDMEQEGYNNSTRIVFQANRGVCTYAYALSYRCARKLLREQGQVQSLGPFDLAVGGMCGDEFKCVSVFPQLLDSYKAAEVLGQDSDTTTSSKTGKRDKGYTNNIVHSTKLNLDLLLKDNFAESERQWPEDPQIVGPMRLKHIGQAVGQAVGSD